MNVVFLSFSAILCLVTLAMLLRPLLLRGSRQTAPRRAEYDICVYLDQLREIDREADSGLLGSSEAEAARAEVKRHLLAAADAAESSERGRGSAAGSGRWKLTACLALLLPAAAAALYSVLGQPAIQDQPIAQRHTGKMFAEGSGDQPMSLADATAQLVKRLESRPDDAAGWFLLGRSYLTMHRYADALGALDRAKELAPGQPEVMDVYVEAALAVSGGRIDHNVHEALLTLSALEPKNPKVQFLLALERAQNGDLLGAVEGWTALLAMGPADAPWVPMVRDHLDRASAQAGIVLDTAKPADNVPASSVSEDPAASSRSLSAADVAAVEQLSVEDRQRTIRQMVERLAARLAEHPDDIDGWRRLARAWEVLNEPEKAAQARSRVAALEQR